MASEKLVRMLGTLHGKWKEMSDLMLISHNLYVATTTMLTAAAMIQNPLVKRPSLNNPRVVKAMRQCVTHCGHKADRRATVCNLCPARYKLDYITHVREIYGIMLDRAHGNATRGDFVSAGQCRSARLIR